MNYEIRTSAGQPAYLQLYRMLRDDIISGIYPYGGRLPSKRTLATEARVSVITVQHATDLLCEEGYVQSRERSGYYVIYRRGDFSGTAMPPDKEDQAAGSFPAASLQKEKGRSQERFPFSVLARTMRKVILDQGTGILEKCPNRGLEELRSEICAYLLRSRGLRVDPAQVIIGSGAEYLYGLIAQLFEKDPVIALEDPSYSKIRQVYEAFGKECELLPLLPDGIRSDALKACRARILHVTPFNSYPSGITAGISKKHEYLDWAGSRGGYIIEDNYDSELTVSRKAEEPLFSIAARHNVLYINTFSKTIAPSVRIGYMVLPFSLTELFEKKLGFYSCTVPVFDQYVLAGLLRSGDYERHINRQRRLRRMLGK